MSSAQEVFQVKSAEEELAVKLTATGNGQISTPL